MKVVHLNITCMQKQKHKGCLQNINVMLSIMQGLVLEKHYLLDLSFGIFHISTIDVTFPPNSIKLNCASLLRHREAEPCLALTYQETKTIIKIIRHI